MMGNTLDGQTNRSVPTATTELPNEGNHCSITTSLINLPYEGKQGENEIHSLRNT